MDVSVLGYGIATHEVIGWAVAALAAMGTLISSLFLKKKEGQIAARLHLAKATSDAQLLRRVETQDAVRLLWQAAQEACVRRQVERAPLHELAIVADELSLLVAEREPFAPTEVVVLVRQLSESLDGLYTPDVDCLVQVTKERLVQAVRNCSGQATGAKFEVVL